LHDDGKYPLAMLRRNVAELIEEIQAIEKKKSYQKAKTKLQETSTIKRVPGSLKKKKVLLRHAKSGGKSPKKRRRKNESEK
jgi:cell fate (sporulation/competence/biofilm development) regulator YmcA (YheA/YmcA/DUF963 family)